MVDITPTVSLKTGRIHEVTGNAADGFAAVAVGRLSGPVIWIGREGDIGSLVPSTLSRFFDPARLVLTQCIDRKEILWSAETALGSGAPDCVVMQLHTGPDLRESRRLQLAAEKGGTLGLVLVSRRVQTSAAQTRWACQSAARDRAPNPANWREPQWDWELIKNKSGRMGKWHVAAQNRRSPHHGGKDHKGRQDRDYAPDHVHIVSAASA